MYGSLDNSDKERMLENVRVDIFPLSASLLEIKKGYTCNWMAVSDGIKDTKTKESFKVRVHLDQEVKKNIEQFCNLFIRTATCREIFDK